MMKKIVSLAVLSALTVTAATAAPSHIVRNVSGGYDVTYDYYDKAKTGWYVGARASLSFMNWENEYSTSPEVGVGDNTEDFSEIVYGGDVFVGRRFNYFWRAEVEAGLIGQFEDKDEGYEFQLTVPYLLANGYYDFANGLYVGAGLGIAMPKTELDDAEFESGGRRERSVSPMGALMVGYSRRLDYNLILDLRYRLAAFGGTEQERSYKDGSSVNGVDLTGVKFTNDIGLILDNSISLGVRYEF